ncbi:MAG: hypothetical protein LUH04_08330, partial [Clostridium sp.]|nr:hypothetical protein [Clostridium sp.]
MADNNIIDSIKKDRLFFTTLPEKEKTPEIYLLQEKLYPDFEKEEYSLINPNYEKDSYIPKDVKLGWNVYTLNKHFEEHSKEKFSFEKIMDVYNGKDFVQYRDKSEIFNPLDESR